MKDVRNALPFRETEGKDHVEYYLGVAGRIGIILKWFSMVYVLTMLIGLQWLVLDRLEGFFGRVIIL
jgi:hypothetical protein